MAFREAGTLYVCGRCLRANRIRLNRRPILAWAETYSTSGPKRPVAPEARRQQASEETAGDGPAEREPGAMSRRLEEATEEALLTGGSAGRRAVEDAGFSEELKERLLSRVADAKFRSDNAAAFAEAELPASAGEGTRTMATAQPWTGEEPQSDAVLRMVSDARKPLRPELRSKPQIPDPVVDMRIRREPAVSSGRRAASARERAAAYAGLGIKDREKGLNDEERAAVRKEFRERFQPGARAMPNTISGLAALANERIEDAIARGQFRDIPRGRDVDRDTRADNPFIDTTEYIMNKMVKRQNMAPPWIEKQQELVRAADVFRARLRSDWRRHAARAIASRGGSLDEQVRRADAFARAEAAHNPRGRNVEDVTVPASATDDPVMSKMRQQAPSAGNGPSAYSSSLSSAVSGGSSAVPLPPPFRDPAWEAAERSYMELAISNLNALTRSYNLMAPDLAKKPYFSVERELRACFADVAPQVAEAIRERARTPAKALGDDDRGSGRSMGILGGPYHKGQAVRVHDSKMPRYGFRDFWRDLWTRDS